MSALVIRAVLPHKLLRPFVYKMWILEGEYRASEDELKRISPNGAIKLVLMYKSSLKSTNATMSRHFASSALAVIGQMTQTTVVDPLGEFGSIGIEFSPVGIYRLFDFPLSDITNCFYSGDEIFGAAGRQLQARLEEIPGLEDKLSFLQTFLLKRLYDSQRGGSTIDHAVRQIVSRNGMIRIEDLSRETGYSMRHLNRKFQMYTGLSPKELAGILRFQHFYKLGWSGDMFEYENIYEHYYDQAHFIKEFKKFTGNTPLTYYQKENQFAEIFYKVNR